MGVSFWGNACEDLKMNQTEGTRKASMEMAVIISTQLETEMTKLYSQDAGVGEERRGD